MKRLEEVKGDRGPIIGAIRACSERPQLEGIFKLFQIEDAEDKTEFLMLAMYNPEVFFADAAIPQKEKFNVILSAFLSGIWKRGDEDLNPWDCRSWPRGR